MIENESYISNETADRILGALLIMCTVLGVYGNGLSLVYFRSLKSNSGNNLFNQKCFLIITAVDLIICLAQIPVIQSLIVGRHKEDLLFTDYTICHIWGSTWAIVQPLSVYLVTVLSCGRLSVLIWPCRKLSLSFPCKFLWASVIALLTLSMVPTFFGQFDVNYNERQVHCFIHPQHPEGSKYHIDRALFSLIRSSFLCLPLLPMLISFVLSVFHLRRAEHDNPTPTTTTRKRRYESRTIQILTGTSLACNIPIVCYEVHLAVALLHHSTGSPAQPQLRDFYLGFVAQDVMTALNSALIPAIYLSRMKPFRRYVGEWGKGRSTNNLVSRVSSLSLCVGNSAFVTRLSSLSSNARLSFFSTTSNLSRPSVIETIHEDESQSAEDNRNGHIDIVKNS